MANYNAVGYDDFPTPASAAEVFEVTREIAVTTALAASDTVNFINKPEGYELVDATLYSDDLDSNGSPQISLNFGAIGVRANSIIAASNVGQAGGMARMSSMTEARAGYGACSLGVTVAAAAATAITGSSVKLGAKMLFRRKGRYS